MVEGYPDMGEWGVLAIFKEAGRLLIKYIRLLHPFILAFLLPVALMQFLQLIGLSWINSHAAPHLFGGLVPDHHYQYHLHHHFGFNALGASNKEASQPLPPWIMRLLLLSIAMSIISWLLVYFALAAISKTVQYIYSEGEEDPSIVKSIFKSLPEAFLRMFITGLWILLVVFVTYFVVSLPFYLLSLAFKDKISPPLLQSVHQAFIYVAVLILEFLFFWSQQVAVLEPENYGQAALKRSSKLVQAKFLTALTIFVINQVFVFILVELYQITILFPSTGKLPYWTVYILAALLALVYLAFAAYWLLVTPVFYFSSKLKYGAEEQALPEENPYRPLAVSTKN